jgi:hypothetical protein
MLNLLFAEIGGYFGAWQVKLALVILAMYGLNRFNTWTETEQGLGKESPPRHYTTRGRYFSYALLYSLSLEFIYLFLLCSPNLLLFIDQELKLKQFSAEVIAGKDFPLILLIALVGAITTLKPFKTLESALRTWFHHQAFIPSQAMALIHQLLNKPDTFLPPDPEETAADEILDDLRDYLPAVYLENCDRLLQPGHDLWHKWFKLLYLRSKIADWQQLPRINQFTLDYGKLYQEQAGHFIELKRDLKYYARRLRLQTLELEPMPGAAGESRHSDEDSRDRLKAKLTQDIDQQLKITYQYLCCGILSSERSQAARKERFRSFGLELHFDESLPFVADSLLKAMFFVFTVTALTTALHQYNTRIEIDLLTVFDIGILHTLIQGSCILLSILLFNCYRRSGWLLPVAEQSRQTGYVVGPMFRGLIGAGAGYLATLLILSSWYARHKQLDLGTAMIQMWPWGLPVAVTSYFILCYLIRIQQQSRRDGRSLSDDGEGGGAGWEQKLERCLNNSWCDGLLQALAQGLVAVLVCYLAANLSGNEKLVQPPMLFYLGLTLSLTGWCIGRVFPQEYRRVLELHRRQRQGEDPWLVAKASHPVVRRDRRSGPRVEIVTAAKVISDQTYPVSGGILSVSGASLPLELPQQVGAPLQLQVPGVGSLLARVIRKSAGHTCLAFILNYNEKRQLDAFLRQQGKPAAQTA